MKYRNKKTGIVAELDPDAAAVLGKAFEPVDDETPLTTEPCCGDSSSESEGK